MVLKSPHLELARWHWKHWLSPGDLAIDATCGNGQDTLFLSQLPVSSIFAVDIQEIAIEKSSEMLRKSLNLARWQDIHLHHMSHTALDHLPLPAKPNLIIYNLGYLPKGNKSFTTRKDTTLASVELALSMAAEKGALSITCYPGHEEGAREEAALVQFTKSLSPKEWQVSHHQWTNRTRSPTFLWIARGDYPAYR